jgi:SAM-dependent methyltransferase
MNIETTLREVAHAYPAGMIPDQLNDISRIAFNIHLALHGLASSGLSICDIGGGVGLFSPGCAALGIDTLLVDDFADAVNRKAGDSVFAVHQKYGVRLASRDVISQGVADIGQRFDVVTSFDSMEHWHHSPKELFRQVRESLLKPGGRFILGVPNCVNLRKRISVPLGFGKWSQMCDWYEEEIFRGHVREPDVDDLRYIARDMRLMDVRIVGRNWLGYASNNKAIRMCTRLIDGPLRTLPSMCSDLYLTGRI